MPKVDETWELDGESALCPPSVPSVLVAANSALKLPVFWPDAVEQWFAQADAQFAIRAITVSKRKFYHTVGSLPQYVAAQILDFIPAPPAGDPYEVLKDRLTTLLSQQLSEVQSFDIPPSHQGSEALSPHE